jgi:hypothetical protein
MCFYLAFCFLCAFQLAFDVLAVSALVLFVALIVVLFATVLTLVSWPLSYSHECFMFGLSLIVLLHVCTLFSPTVFLFIYIILNAHCTNGVVIHTYIHISYQMPTVTGGDILF